MKLILSALIVLASSAAFAQNSCDKWANNPRFVKAINVVAANEGYTFEQLCTLPKILDVEAQPTRKIERDGTVIPHVRVQLHMEYSSCLYMVRDADLAITENRCYSGF